MKARSLRWPHLVALALVVAIVAAGITSLFAWPSVNMAPRHVPIGVAPAQAATQVKQALDQAQPGAFTVTSYPDEQAAVAAIKDRKIYGAFVLGGAEPTILTAPAGGPAVATMLEQVGRTMAAAQNGGAEAGPTVTAVVGLPSGDPRGAGLPSTVLPMVLISIITGAIATFVVAGRSRKLAFIGMAAIFTAIALTLVTDNWLGVLPGNWLAEAGLFALGIGATSLALAGLGQVLRAPGFGLGVAIVMLLGNPLSGANGAPEMLPTGWGSLGQALPPGALATATRSVGYFDGAGAAGPLIVLVCWLAAGLVLFGVGMLVNRDRPASDTAPAA